MIDKELLEKYLRNRLSQICHEREVLEKSDYTKEMLRIRHFSKISEIENIISCIQIGMFNKEEG